MKRAAPIENNGDWYPDYELAALGLVNVREPGSGVLSSSFEMKEVVVCSRYSIDTGCPYAADECCADRSDLDRFRGGLDGYSLSNRDRLPHEPGFPWITQWIIERRPDDELADPTGERATGGEPSPPSTPNSEGETDPVRIGIETPPERVTTRRVMCARVLASETGSANACDIHLYAGDASALKYREQETILSWLLGTVTDSSQIEHVTATVYCTNAAPNPPMTYRIKDRPAKLFRPGRHRYFQQESFLIKRYVQEIPGVKRSIKQ